MCVVYSGNGVWGKIKEKSFSFVLTFFPQKILLLLIRRGHGYTFFLTSCSGLMEHNFIIYIFFHNHAFPSSFFFFKRIFFLGEESTWKHGEFILVVKWKWNGILLSSQCRSLACAYMWVYDLDHRVWEVSTQVTRVWQSSMEWEATKMYMVLLW